MEKLISIVVPIYNTATYLNKCIDSILAQTYRKLQIILVDDGSTDESGIICDNYAKMDYRIEVIHRENGGTVVARKTGIMRAKGEYIGFVDSDDYIEPAFYETLLNKMLKTDVDFVHSGYIMEDGDKRVKIQSSEEFVLNEKDRIEIIKKHIFGHEATGHALAPSLFSKMYKLDFLKSCFFQVPDYAQHGEDLICLCHCILKSRSFIEIPYSGYHYIVRSGSMDHKITEDIFLEYAILFAELYKLFENYDEKAEMRDRLSRELRRHMIECLNTTLQGEFFVPSYLFPDIGSLSDKKIIIYGAGVVGKSYYSQIMLRNNCTVVAWADKKNNNSYDGFNIVPECLSKYNYDYILIAVKKLAIADEIRNELISMGIDSNKIIWKEPKIDTTN